MNGTCLEDGNSCQSSSIGGGGSIPPGAIVVPPSNSAQWAATSAQLLKMGFTLAAQAQLKPGQVILPNGTILQQTPGVPVPFGSGLTTSLSSLGSSNVLMYGVLAAVALFAFSGRSR